MKRLMPIIFLSGCAGFYNPYDYFPRSSGDPCPKHFSYHYPSYLEAISSVKSGGMVRRHKWIERSPGLCNISGYAFISHANGAIMFYGEHDIVPFVPSKEDEAADDWESV